jgi:pimeloyl-ACP methyl ester carboxylesterase
VRPIVVGWSLGGAVALDYAVRYPAELSGIVLVDHNVHVVKTPDLPLGVEPEYLQRVLQLMREDYEGAGADAVLEGWMADGQEDLTEIRSVFKQSILNTPKEVVLAMRSIAWDDRRPVMRKVTVPTLVLQGAASRLGGPDMASYIQAHIPHARVHLFEGHGHALHVTAPEEFHRVLEEFVRDLS